MNADFAGGLIIAQLPGSAAWAIGMLAGINMISSGWPISSLRWLQAGSDIVGCLFSPHKTVERSDLIGMITPWRFRRVLTGSV